MGRRESLHHVSAGNKITTCIFVVVDHTSPVMWGTRVRREGGELGNQWQPPLPLCMCILISIHYKVRHAILSPYPCTHTHTHTHTYPYLHPHTYTHMHVATRVEARIIVFNIEIPITVGFPVSAAKECHEKACCIDVQEWWRTLIHWL